MAVTNLSGELKVAIARYILASTNEEVLSSSRVKWMADNLTAFVIDAVEKFAAGQQEHSSEIEDCDLKRELRQEIMDSFWYISALRNPLKKP